MRIAMWSGPRNLSTAMMYSFGARADFAVMDEPFYAANLQHSGRDHPMRDQIIAAHETDPAKVSEMCKQDGAPHLYMKHMPHHMLDGFPMDWAKGCKHVFLIRDPARVIASYAAKTDLPTLEDLGLPQQLALLNQFDGFVIDSFDIRKDPEHMLRRLCDHLEIPWDPAMLSWPAGPKPYDGVWAAHWYDAVHRSTGFAGAEGPVPRLTGKAAELNEQAQQIYAQLWRAAAGFI